MILSDAQIMLARSGGRVVIDPYVLANVNTSSYDVTLGHYYYRECAVKHPPNTYTPYPYFYNIYSEQEVNRVWGKSNKAIKAKDCFAAFPQLVQEGMNEDDELIIISPGETILCHTQEFIGGVRNITTMMKARSSFGHNFIRVCACAGMGDVGYFNRWTMQISSGSQHYHIPLVVGRRIAQIVFMETGETTGQNYSLDGKYQASSVLEELKRDWTPSMMLPRLYQDRDIKR